MPIEYKNTSLIHAWQWAIGLEWYLMVAGPWRVVMSTDHPNGGSFLAYPQIIRLLMDRTYRQDMLKTAPRKVREQSALAGLDRQYTLVGDRHHHPGRPGSNPRPEAQGPPRPGCRRRHHDLYAGRKPGDHVRPAAFRHQVGPRSLSNRAKSARKPYGKTLHVAPDYDRDVETDIQRWFEKSYSIQWRNYPVDSRVARRFMSGERDDD